MIFLMAGLIRDHSCVAEPELAEASWIRSESAGRKAGKALEVGKQQESDTRESAQDGL
jgi:hypothetical protein